MTAEAQAREAVWRSKLEKVRSTYDDLAADQQYWHKREKTLGEAFVKLEDDYQAVVDKYKGLKNASKGTFAVALLEVTSNLVSAGMAKLMID